jgi:hypothetical protein
MIHVRHPNRRPQRGLDQLLNGGLCIRSGKLRYFDERSAEQTREQLAKVDPDPDALHVYWCGGCRDWHVGHVRPPSERAG